MSDPIKRLRELLEKATNGPWCGCQYGHIECREIADLGGIEIHSPSSPFVRAAPEDDAALIVAAVNAMPALLDALEAFQDVAEQANGQLSDDYLWEKWRLNEQMEKGRAALAKLEAQP